MPIIRPNLNEIEPSFEENDGYIDCETQETLQNILEQNGVQVQPENLENSLAKVDTNISKFRRTLNASGASVENASRTIAKILKTAKFDNSRLKAAELVLDLHGIRDKEGKVQQQPIFQFIIKDSAVNLNQVFMPVRIAPPAAIDNFAQNVVIDSDVQENSDEQSVQGQINKVIG